MENCTAHEIIGWSSETHQHNLPLVVKTSRFLIVPWIKTPNLASHILWGCQKRLPQDWKQRYSFCPALLESFCETPRFKGTCYQMANWICVGQTQGRGNLDVNNEHALPIKDI